MDVEPEEHAVAFNVAKATSMDVLRDIREELQTALDEGLPFAEFKKRLQPRLEARGWWGYGGARDQLDGQEKPALLGTPRRLRTIYDANLRSARAAGQWDRIERSKKALPFLTYRLGPSERHRPHHETKDGLTLPVDDPFWATWYPPNGWGCKCWVRQITRREAEQIGIDESPAVETRPWTNMRTGEVRKIPVGIDPGWETNPGAARLKAMQDHLTGRVTRMSDTAANVAARDLATSWRAARILSGDAPGAVPAAVLPADLANVLGSDARTVLISADTAAKQLTRHAEINLPDYARVADLVSDSRVMLHDGSLVFVQRTDDLPWVAAIKRTKDGTELYLTTLYLASSARYITRLLARGVTVRE